jgi:hypothetical protein
VSTVSQDKAEVVTRFSERRNLSGRSHATVKAQLPPLLPPQMPHLSGDWAMA